MLEVEDLHVSYGKVAAVMGVGLTAESGKITLVLGANGAGKSTTLRAVAGLVPVRSGQVRLDGATVTGTPAFKMVRRGLVIVPEGRRVFAPLSVEDNLRLGGYTAAKSALATAMDRVLELFPILAERRHGAAGLLSGGEQQMLAFGRALMSGPRIILMDEPSMGLAPTMVDVVMHSVRQIADSGIAVVMVEQNAAVGLDIADTVTVLARGEVMFSGPAATARSNSAVVHAYLGEGALADS